MEFKSLATVLHLEIYFFFLTLKLTPLCKLPFPICDAVSKSRVRLLLLLGVHQP
jgi:hypothetical protein